MRINTCPILRIARNGQSTLSPGAYLAINALAYTDDSGDIIRRRLEMNWFGLDDPANVYVSLYDEDPSAVDGSGRSQMLEPLLSLHAEEFPDGFYTTDIELSNMTNEEIG